MLIKNSHGGRSRRATPITCGDLPAAPEVLELCAGAAGELWANIGTLVYGVEETTLKKLTGANKNNPTMSLPCRTVFEG